MNQLLTWRRLVSVGLWLVALLGTAFLVRAYVKKQIAPIVWQQPVRYVMEVLTSPRAAPPTRAPDDVCLEMEAAPDLAPSGPWKTVRADCYTGGAAVSTHTVGAELTFPVNLPAGPYTLNLRASALPRRGENQVTVAVGKETCQYCWRFAYLGSPRELTQTVVLSEPATTVRLRADRIRQQNLVLDRLLIHRGVEVAGDPWWRYLGMLAAVAGLFAAAGAWGAFAWVRLRPGEGADPLVRLILQEVVGLTLLATLTTVLGILGWFRFPLVTSILAAGLLAGGRPLLRSLGCWLAALRRDFRPRRAIGLACVVVPLAALAAASMTPATSMDPQIYHLPIAKWLIAEGGFHYHPYQMAWGYPHNTSNLFAITQLLDNDPFFRTAALTHAALGLLWLAGVYALGKTLFGRTAGLAAVVLCVAINGVVWEFSMAVVDLSFACFAGAALLSFVLALRSFESGGHRRWLVLSALLAGGAAGCKVHGPEVAVALGIAGGLWLWRRQSWRAGLAWFCLIGGLSFAVVSPMYLKNWLLYNDPVFPFTTLFPNRDLTPELVRQWFTDDKGQDFKLMTEGPRPFWQWPYTWTVAEFMEPTSPGPGFLVGILLLPLLGTDWLRRHWPLLLSVGLMVVLWLVMAPLTRFTYPWLAILLVLACAPLSRRALRWPGLLISVALVLCAGASILEQVEGIVPQWTHVLQRQSNERYLHWIEPATGTLDACLLDDIWQLNREYREAGWGGYVLIDADHLAYADFLTVPAGCYFWARGGGWHQYTPVAGAEGKSAFAHQATRLADPDLLQELTGRLQVGRILVRKPEAMTHPRSGDAARMDQVLERWARTGIVSRRELSGTILYTFDQNRVESLLQPAAARVVR